MEINIRFIFCCVFFRKARRKLWFWFHSPNKQRINRKTRSSSYFSFWGTNSLRKWTRPYQIQWALCSQRPCSGFTIIWAKKTHMGLVVSPSSDRVIQNPCRFVGISEGTLFSDFFMKKYLLAAEKFNFQNREIFKKNIFNFCVSVFLWKFPDFENVISPRPVNIFS